MCNPDTHTPTPELGLDLEEVPTETEDERNERRLEELARVLQYIKT